MIRISITVEPAPGTEIIGVKEDIATYLERFGDIKAVDVKEIEYEQINLRTWGA